MQVQTLDEARKAVKEAVSAAQEAVEATVGTVSWFPCGFAHVHISDDGRTKRMQFLRAACAEAGERLQDDWPKGWAFLWGGTWGGQEMLVKEAGCRAAAEVLKSYGYSAYMTSRMD
jgi:hypothetical protein